MQTAGPYRLQRALSSCEVGDVWSAIDEKGRSVTVAVLNDRASVDERWRGAFAAAAEALGQTGADQLPIVASDHDGARPWVACAVERGAGAAEIFSALGQRLGPVPVPAAPVDPPAEETTAMLWQAPPLETAPAPEAVATPAAGNGVPPAAHTSPPAAAQSSPWDLPPGAAQDGPDQGEQTTQLGIGTEPAGPAVSPREAEHEHTTQLLSTIQPAAAQPPAAPHIPTQPTSAQPTSAQPVSAQPVSAQPTSAQPVSAQPVPFQGAPGQYEPIPPGEPAPYPPATPYPAGQPAAEAQAWTPVEQPPSPGYQVPAQPAPAYPDGSFWPVSPPPASSPISGASVSGASVSGAPISGASVSAEPVSGASVSGGPGYPYRSRVFGDQPPAKPRRTGLLLGVVAVVCLLLGAGGAVAVMALTDDSGTSTPAPPTPEELLLPTAKPTAPGVEPPRSGGWPSSWAEFRSADPTKPMNGLAGLGFDFRVPPTWDCTKVRQAKAAVHYRCGEGTGESLTIGGDLIVRDCIKPCTEDRRTSWRQMEEAWGLRWTRSGSYTAWARTEQVEGLPVYGLVYVAFWRSVPEGEIDRELVLRMTSPLADSDDLKKVANSIRDQTFTL